MRASEPLRLLRPRPASAAGVGFGAKRRVARGAFEVHPRSLRRLHHHRRRLLVLGQALAQAFRLALDPEHVPRPRDLHGAVSVHGGVRPDQLRSQRRGVRLGAPDGGVAVDDARNDLDHLRPPRDGLAPHRAPHHVRARAVQGRDERTTATGRTAVLGPSVLRFVLGREFVPHRGFVKRHLLRSGRRHRERLPPLPGGGVAEAVARLHAHDERLARHRRRHARAVHLGTLQLRDARRRSGLPGEHHRVERRAVHGLRRALSAEDAQRVPPRDARFETHLARAVASLHGFDLRRSDARHLHAEGEQVRPRGHDVAEAVEPRDPRDASGARG
mmetsp:Transcript_13183/g.55378  ORF Transcript_13183/g.55378 Transcript_13183/m.55378 type:complete len:330 (-) Transcript_13183:2726-3715(-)